MKTSYVYTLPSYCLFSLPTLPSKAVRLKHAMEPLSAVVETGLAGSSFAFYYPATAHYSSAIHK